ncbi:unnamed protein product [Xylocopa violacea]|uniref:Uncharacterized protein n=1 Tax=Xylocopa violacea TaxID=135666 RepID=A0ABP1N4Z4_XYLVO
MRTKDQAKDESGGKMDDASLWLPRSLPPNETSGSTTLSRRSTLERKGRGAERSVRERYDFNEGQRSSTRAFRSHAPRQIADRCWIAIGTEAEANGPGSVYKSR